MKKLRLNLKIRILLAALMVGAFIGKLIHGHSETWEAPFYMGLTTFLIVTDVTVATAVALLLPSEGTKP